jgi:hypothetical protein|tara:strand:+ start:353 stop:583 length:231 start_codon:yes stop_codon:yes gene_type:complete
MKDLKKIINLVIEELGRMEKKAFHGWGTVQPHYKHSDKQMLGNPGEEGEEEDVLKNPVKVSRAFSNVTPVDDPQLS